MLLCFFVCFFSSSILPHNEGNNNRGCNHAPVQISSGRRGRIEGGEKGKVTEDSHLKTYL